jgi:hypothetical protein
LQITLPVFKQIKLFLFWMFLAELTAWMFKHLLSVDCRHLNEELMFNCESEQMNIAIQECSQEDTALYRPVHQLHLSSLFHREGDMTKCYLNHLKLFQVIRPCVQNNEENVSTMLPPGWWHSFGPPIHYDIPSLFLQIDCHAFTLVLPLACRCQYTIPSGMDILSRTATYPLCRLCHCQNSTKQVILLNTLIFLPDHRPICGS